MSKLQQKEYQRTMSLLISAHIASQVNVGLNISGNKKIIENIVESANHIAIQIMLNSKQVKKRLKNSVAELKMIEFEQKDEKNVKAQ